MTTLHGTILGLSQKRGEEKLYSLQRDAGGYRWISAAEYLRNTLQFSAYVKSRGVGVGDRVVLISENGPEWTMAALAVMNLGAVVVPVAAIASPLEISHTVKDAQPKLGLLSKHLSAFRSIKDLLEAEGREFLVWDLQADEPLAEWTKLAPLSVNEAMGADAQAFLIYTSGTTGSPKAVPISHGNVLANARAVLPVIEASRHDRLVSVLPLSHMFEFTGGFVTPTLLGCSITYVKSLKAEDLLRALKDSQATVLVGVPLLFEVIGRNLQAKLNDLPPPLRQLFASFSTFVRAHPAWGRFLFYPIHRALGGHIRYFMAGGSRLQPAVFDFFRGLGITVLQGYGLTETSPVLTVTSPANAAADHVGAPLPGVTIKIFDEQGRELPQGEEGEIWAKGPNVFRGYLNPAHNKDVFFDGWFRTGDLGSFTPEGLLRITGRKKDLIVTAAGKNVYPEEIEQAVLATKFFLEACVLALPDAAGHEKVGLVLVPDRTKFPGRGIEEIRREAARIAAEQFRELADYKWPQTTEVLFEELPKTSTRKVKKHEVRKLLAGRTSAGSISQKSGLLDLGNDLERAVAEGIHAIAGIAPSAIGVNDPLSEFGLDSLTFVELVSHVEKKFSTRIEGLEFAQIQTVKDLVTSLEFAAQPAKRKFFFQRIYFTDFSPWENSRPLWRFPRRFTNILLRSYLRIRHDLRVEGLENLRGPGPFVFTPNHSSHFDLLSIDASIPGHLVHFTFAVAAKDYFFNRSWKALAARILVNAIPFDRKSRIEEGLQRCREAMAVGGSLVIFPEGTRSPDGKLQDFKPGVAHLLNGHPNAQAIPVFIDGAHAIMPKGAKFPGSGSLRVRYGQPISFRDAGTDSESLRRTADRLRAEVAALQG